MKHWNEDEKKIMTEAEWKAAKEVKVEEPVVEEPKVEEPKVEEQVEAPITEEPAQVEKPKNSRSKK